MIARTRLWACLGLALWLSAHGAASAPDTHSSADVDAVVPSPAEPKIGLALGGGGANGLAHIAILEVFDELGLRPHRITGTSIGAIMGALYASGLTGQEIKSMVDDLVVQRTDTWRDLVLDRQIVRWMKFIAPELGEGGLIGGEAFVSHMLAAIGVDTFEELHIPLALVTADLWTREQVVLTSGALAPAVQASFAIPGLFSPVQIDDRVLVDGGLVNPVPYDLLFEDCDIVIAVNVIGYNDIEEEHPSFLRAMFISVRVMQSSILREKLKQRAPDIFIDTRITGVRSLQFHKLDDIYEQAQPSADRLRAAWGEMMEHK